MTNVVDRASLTVTASEDLFHLICGDKIGEGQYRIVFEYVQDPTKVIKLDTRLNWSNVHEHTMWTECNGTGIEKWLAPIYWLSPGSVWMIQARTTPIKTGKYPKKVPACFADIKPENWGMYKGRPVCHDYANSATHNMLRTHGSKLKQALWEHHV